MIQLNQKIARGKKIIREKERREEEEEIMNEKLPNIDLWQAPSKEIVTTTSTPELHVVDLYPFTLDRIDLKRVKVDKIGDIRRKQEASLCLRMNNSKHRGRGI